MKTRKTNKSRYSHLYHRKNAERSDNNLYWRCVYCGEPADQLDHVPPLTRVDDYKALGIAKEIYITVPCCGDCNSSLSNSLQDNIFERIDHLKSKLYKKYAKSTSAEWDDDEIAELGPALRSHVVAATRSQSLIKRRYEYEGGYAALMNSYDWI